MNRNKSQRAPLQPITVPTSGLAFGIFLACIGSFSLSSAAETNAIIRGGLTLANYSVSSTLAPGEKLKMRTGFNFGALGEFPIDPTIHAIVGVGFENRGADDSYSVSGLPLTAHVKLDYFTVPLLGSFKFPLGGTSGSLREIFLNAGVEPAILLSAKVVSDSTYDIKDYTTKYGLSICGEGGGEFSLSPSLLGLIGIGMAYDLMNNNPNKTVMIHLYEFRIFFGLKFGIGN